MNKDEWVLMQGNEAIAEGALLVGCKFFAGYPITPSTEIAEILAQKLPIVDGIFAQMEDEIASIAAIIGASIGGVKSLTATSGPGFSLMQENIGYAAMAEVPLVIVNVMRGGPSTGLPTSPAQGDIMQARWGSHGDKPTIALCPSSVEEALRLTIRAFNLSEKYRTPVFLLVDEGVGHMRERVRLPKQSEIRIVNRLKPTIPPEWYKHYENSGRTVMPRAAFGEGYRFHITGLTHDEEGFPTSRPTETKNLMNRLKRKITRNKADIVLVETADIDDAEIVIFAYGSVARSATQAVLKARESGIKAGLFRPLTIWPFPSIEIGMLLNKVKKIIVAEMNQGQLINEVKRYVKSRDVDIIPMHRFDGHMITPDQIMRRIEEVI